ncbi:MAG TPA: hypothetical protein VFW40_05435 [Capsulimonadaceae bacterium]|nr:hypothetical protein [Capsulimonadaceae bacterium]
MVYEVVHCAECGKPIKSVPSWLAGVEVKFSCEACRQKHPRPFLGPDAAAPARGGGRRSSEDAEEEPGVAASDEEGQVEDGAEEDFVEEDAGADENNAE